MDIRIEWHDRLASTNTTLRERLADDPRMAGGLVVAAREQTSGRGRQDRPWVSPPGVNLCFSLLVRTAADPMNTPSLAMAVALAVADTLARHGIAAAPKWPNDVLVGDRKICGILSERVEWPGEREAGIVVGVGLNVNMTGEEAAAIDRPATSMRMASGRIWDLRRVLEELLASMARRIAQWEEDGFAGIRDEWGERTGPIGRPLAVHDGSVVKSGRLAGYGSHGELLLDTGTRVETIWSGDMVDAAPAGTSRGVDRRRGQG